MTNSNQQRNIRKSEKRKQLKKLKNERSYDVRFRRVCESSPNFEQIRGMEPRVQVLKELSSGDFALDERGYMFHLRLAILTDVFKNDHRAAKFKKASVKSRAHYVKTLADTLMFCLSKRKYENGFHVGYHVHSRFFNALRNNPIAKNLMSCFFGRAERSTYHVNNGRWDLNESNGYTHWYVIKKDMWRIYTEAKMSMLHQDQHNKKYAGKFAKSAKPYAKSVPKVTKYEQIPEGCFSVGKKQFEAEFKLFERGKSPGFCTILKNVRCTSEKCVYINNESKRTRKCKNLNNPVKYESEIPELRTDESMRGRGRIYSTLSSLDKDMRKRLLPGWVEIDVQASVQSVLMSLVKIDFTKEQTKDFTFDLSADESTLRPEKDTLNLFPKHQKLLKDTGLFRTTFAPHTGGSKNVKQAITQMSYAPRSNINRKYGTDPKQKAKAKKPLKEFKYECSHLQNYCLQTLYNAANCGTNLNYRMGDLTVGDIKSLVDEEIAIQDKLAQEKQERKHPGVKKRKRNLKPRIMFRIYELLESLIRKSMTNYVFENGRLTTSGKHNILQIHDCLLMPTPCKINLKELSDYVFKDTLLRVKFSIDPY